VRDLPIGEANSELGSFQVLGKLKDYVVILSNGIKFLVPNDFEIDAKVEIKPVKVRQFGVSSLIDKMLLEKRYTKTEILEKVLDYYPRYDPRLAKFLISERLWRLRKQGHKLPSFK